MSEVVRRVAGREPAEVREQEQRREWLVTNGLGGYASGTVQGPRTRRSHGLLVAALPSPRGRTLLLEELSEALLVPGRERCIQLGAASDDGCGEQAALAEFRLELGLPVWRFTAGEVALERRILMPHGQNTVHAQYRLLQGPPGCRLELRPWFHFRGHQDRVDRELPPELTLLLRGEQHEVRAGEDELCCRVCLHGPRGTFTADAGARREMVYALEAERGYDSRGHLASPGFYAAMLEPGQVVALVASAEPWAVVSALSPAAALETERARRRELLERAAPLARTGPAAELVLAADQFVIQPATRAHEDVWAHASGIEGRTVVAGYPWFTDWGRDTMISLEGLTLLPGRHQEAAWILRTFAHHVRDGLIPNMFPEGDDEGRYHTADATLWFFHALERYRRVTGDRGLVRSLLPVMRGIVEHHLRGTRFGIGVDPADGLLRQGAEGYQLTWMDAKVDDWVVTPRRGKAVEINALWFNALRLLAGWLEDEDGPATARPLLDLAERTRAAFNARFWCARAGHLYDVVDGEQGDDLACRPNQLFAISLDHPVLDEERWEPVLRTVIDRLLTPYGLRTLAPGHPDYRRRYFGDLRSRDAAYHQGTVWPWLIGPFVDAWLRVRPDDDAGARRHLDVLLAQLSESCVGSISEIHDAEAPFVARGCPAQAWSVAELLRAWVRVQEAGAPPVRGAAAAPDLAAAPARG